MILIGLTRPRPQLFERIDARIEKMVSGGLIEEVKGLIAEGYSPDLPSMSAIGYQEIGQYIIGNISLDEAIVLMKRRTRQFVRRQAAWFKPSDPRISWFNLQEDSIEEVIDAIRQRVIS